MKKVLFLLLFPIISFAQKPIFTSAKAKAATIYFNAAEISQTANLFLPTGNSEIVIKNIANNINENTVQVGVPNSVTVLSVQFTNDYISEYEIDEKNPAIKKVRDSITFIKREIQKNQIQQNSNQQLLTILEQNKVVGGINSGLNVLELTKLVDYYKAKRIEVEVLLIDIQEKSVSLNTRLQSLENKLELNTFNAEKSSTGKLILNVMNSVAGNIKLDINYITNAASWVPFYDLRVDNIKDPINMSYKAQVVQNSGIDWKNVKLTLSSGNPNQNNQAPDLNAWFLRYKEVYYQDKEEIILISRGVRAEAAPIFDQSISKNGSAIRSVNANINENQLNISFDIDIPYDILSNGKVHSVALKNIELPASYKYYAAPKADKDAFLLAELKDYSKYNLLQGEANIIFEGLYVGKTNINPNQTSDTLNLSMGRDKKINIKREKVADKSGTKFLSSFKEQTFTYDLIVRNNKKEEINILLKDQYPLSTDKDITVELLEDGNAKVNKETGILTWDLKLQANETKKVRISYIVRYPKDKVISNF